MITTMADRSAMPPAPKDNLTAVQEKEPETLVARSVKSPPSVSASTVADVASEVKQTEPLNDTEATSEQAPIEDIETYQKQNTPPSAEIIIIPQKPSQWGETTRGIVHRVNVRNASNVKTVFLTINAYSNNQEALIHELIRYNIKATFFIILLQFTILNYKVNFFR